ncbi:MAG: filamentous hemagglutinin N-terminal domain-containing protein [Hormoscilla sp.]
MNKIYQRAKKVTGAVLVSLLLTPVARAQIIPDITLPSNSVVTPSGNSSIIEGGTTAGSNLFHSFREFSVPAGSEAFFDNAADISNILTRVTGGQISNIDGLIRANGRANVFLLNPNGIIFGENARLSIGGSFFGTTANSIVFENGYQFSATAQQTQPLLTISVPIGLQWGGQTGEIRVRGEGHSLTTADPIFASIVREDNGLGLQVNPDRTLALVGGDVRLEGAILRAAGGRIELGGVSEGFVGLTAPSSLESSQWRLSYDEVSGFNDVRLLEQSAVDVSGTGVGSIAIVGNQIVLRDGSIALLQNLGSQTFGSLRVQASESLTLTGKTPDALIPSSLYQETLGEGNAGDLEIESRQLMIEEGAAIVNQTLGSGNPGGIDIRASESIEVTGASPIDPLSTSSISNSSLGTGSGGDIEISTRNLSFRGGGNVVSVTFGTGSAGNILINATETAELLGSEPRSLTPSSIASSTVGQGDAGSTIVNASVVIVRDGGRITSGTFAFGNGGRVVVNGTEFVEVSGIAPGSINPSLIDSSANQLGEVIQQALGLPTVPSGSPGDVEINTPRLRVTDEGEVTVRNDGTGRAGNLQVNAESIFLNKGGDITASTRSGEGGNIELNLDSRLLLRNGSGISATAGGTGNGGNITINSSTIALLENSSITANAFEGNGGNISIVTRGILVSPDSRITASSELGVDGLIEITNPEVDSTAGLVELSQNPLKPGDRIVQGCGAVQGSQFILTGRGGLPPNPERQLTGDRPWTDLRDLSAFRSEVATNGSSSDPHRNADQSIVEANAIVVHPDGTVELLFDRQVHQAQMQAARVRGCNGSPLNTRREN